MSKKKYESELHKVKARNASHRRKQDLENQKEYGIRLPSMSKIVLMTVVFLCLEIVIFCEWIMVATGDTSALYALIGVPTTLVPIVVSYYSKSAKENTTGGIVFETALNDFAERAEG